MSLVLEVEYLSGVSFATIGPDGGVPDWPPQPDRIFSALVAAWASRGQQEDEARALAWLETRPCPHVFASHAYQRTSAVVFVPPNDPRSDKQKSARGVLPAMRNRQARRFPATRPLEPLARFVWRNVVPEESTLAALERLARDTAYVGHSASLTRCRFFSDSGELDSAGQASTQRGIYAGRFAELRDDFEAGRRPLHGPTTSVMPHAMSTAITNVFGDRWLLLEHVGDKMPDLRACAIVAKAIRDALLSGYRRIGLENDIPETVSGHTADGKPSRSPHIAIVPLPFVGFPYADGHVMGYALIPPREGGLRDDPEFLRALRAIAPMDHERQRRILTIKPRVDAARDHGFSIDFSLTLEPSAGQRSLEPSLYMRSACSFATVTPIALDRHLKREGDARAAEMQTQIAASCRNIGLPEPIEIIVDKHAALEGAPSAYPSGKSPEWMRWRLPTSLASRQLTHAVIRFAEPVAGPMILGAGRFVGIGLCRPVDGGSR
jgi:CRISPR-associated protein Csb2